MRLHVSHWIHATLVFSHACSLVESLETLAGFLAENTEVDEDETVLNVTGDSFAIVVERVRN